MLSKRIWLHDQAAPLTLFTEGPRPSPLAGTSSAHMVAQCVVLTLTPMAAPETKQTCWAL